MGRPAAMTVRRALAGAVLASVPAWAGAGCGDPVAVLGDTPGLMRIVAGVAEQPGRDVGPSATETRLRFPSGVDMDLDGVLYLADRDNRRILAVSSSGEIHVVVDDLGCSQSCLREVSDLALDRAGGIVVADDGGHRVWRFDIATGVRSVLAGTGVFASTPDGEPAATSPIRSPRGVAVGDDGAVYFAEGRSHRIRTILTDGTLFTVAGTGVPGFGGDGGQASAAEIEFPSGVDVAGQVVYFADTGNHRVRSVSLVDGTIRTVAGVGQPGFSGDGGDAASAALSEPRDVAVTEDGRFLYVADASNHRIRVVSLFSRAIGTFVGNGETEFSGDLQEAGAVQLHRPLGVGTSPFGLVLVADTEHHIVWRTPTGF